MSIAANNQIFLAVNISELNHSTYSISKTIQLNK